MEAVPVVKNKVLGGRVLYPTIIRKPVMNSLADLVEIQSWTHLFITKSLVMHEDQVREFYYNVEFNGDRSLHALVGDKRVQLNEELLGEILEVPIEGIMSVAGKHCTLHFANECSKLLTCIVQTVIERKGKHGMGYGCFLTNVFDHLKVLVGPGHLSKMSQLVVERDQLKCELEELTALVGKKDVETALLKAKLAKI
ncbi:hypothetical protein KY284_032989 [Solanum tuberosum]|nr:hypothetical protein KY284_032989 [Solanum tuberosum]